MQTGKIVWLSEGVPESVHDLTKVQNCGLLSKLLSREFILADKAYIEENCFIHPIKPAITIEKKNSIQQLVVSVKL